MPTAKRHVKAKTKVEPVTESELNPEKEMMTEPETGIPPADYVRNPTPGKPVPWMQYGFVGLLLIAAFFLGSLYTKVQYLEKNQTAKPTAAAVAGDQPQATPTVGDVPKVTDKDHIRGNTTANVVLVEYSDFECPFCKRFHPTMLQVEKDYGNKIAWVYRHYPLDFHANAQKEAEAAECAAELGGNDAFWKYADALYDRTTSNGTGFALDKLVPLAVEFGLSEGKFKDCLDSGKYAQTVKDMRDGGQKAGVQGTPGTVVWNLKSGKKQLIPGALPYESVKAAIDELLK